MVINVILSIGKIIAGIVGSSAAMVSDGIHSASDVFSTFIVIAGIKMSNKASDADHQYGHEKIEYIAAILLSFILLLTGLGIGYAGAKNIFAPSYDHLKAPAGIALIAAIVSIIVKEAMYHYTKHAAQEINSGSLMADAWHHRSDALSSVGSFIGIGAAMYGFPIMDSVASIVICLMIIYAAWEIFLDATDKLVDHACDQATEDAMQKVIEAVPGVLHVDRLQTRIFGAKIYVDVEFSAHASLSLLEGHTIADHVHKAIEKDFPTVKHCMVHVNPDTEKVHDF
ncbi:MAG: cation diffusion facilitator family transporter [Acidaminococcaceae bacterium]|nr:cation diffusion facilitator family transporter [Acidaminococcaceae bacterium]